MCDVAPDPVDVTDLQFRALPKIQLGRGQDLRQDVPDATGFQGVAVSNQFGRLWAVTEMGLAILDVRNVENLADDTNLGQVPGARTLALPATPTHVALSADEMTLAVVVQLNEQPHIYFYDTRSLQTAGDIKPFTE
eukprot:maker-scaffold64_size435223-snap-gene-2.24 protein:Tk02489 transcript:maker-scaffold64_size435223-snap-gene-2.24-mRNA-1 annotation:"lytic catalytic"